MHRAKTTQEWLRDKSLSEWPGQSLDLNPIEHSHSSLQILSSSVRVSLHSYFQISPERYAIPSGLRLVGLSFVFFNRTMIQHTSRLCKCYLTKKECDGVLHQMTWPPQSHDLNPVEMVWDELDHRVKEKQPTGAQHMNSFKTVGKAFLMKLVKSVHRCHQGKRWLFEESKIYFHLFDIFWLLHDSLCFDVFTIILQCRN